MWYNLTRHRHSWCRIFCQGAPTFTFCELNLTEYGTGITSSPNSLIFIIIGRANCCSTNLIEIHVEGIQNHRSMSLHQEWCSCILGTVRWWRKILISLPTSGVVIWSWKRSSKWQGVDRLVSKTDWLRAPPLSGRYSESENSVNKNSLTDLFSSTDDRYKEQNSKIDIVLFMAKIL